MKKLILAVLAISIVFTSCTKKSDNPTPVNPDQSKPITGMVSGKMDYKIESKATSGSQKQFLITLTYEGGVDSSLADIIYVKDAGDTLWYTQQVYSRDQSVSYTSLPLRLSDSYKVFVVRTYAHRNDTLVNVTCK